MHHKLFFLALLGLSACGSPYVPPAGGVFLPAGPDMTSTVADVGLEDMEADAPEVQPPPDMERIEPEDASRDMKPPAPSGGAPKILDFSTNITTVFPSSQLVFSVIVTDPDGIEDLIGGSLRTPQGQSFGAFATAASEGSYQITLTWEAIAAVRVIEYQEAEGMTQTFIAEFYDQGGARTQAQLNLQFVCAGEFERACEPNECIDLRDSLNHCGQCDAPVPPDTSDYGTICIGGVVACGESRSSGLVLWCENESLCPISDTACVWCDNSCEDISNRLFSNDTVERSSCLPDRSTACSFRVSTTTLTSCAQVCGTLECDGANAEYEFSSRFLGCQETPEHFGAGSFLRLECYCNQPIN